jgi:hypothetical protein
VIRAWLFLPESIARAVTTQIRTNTSFHTIRRSRAFVIDLATFFHVLACVSATVIT